MFGGVLRPPPQNLFANLRHILASLFVGSVVVAQCVCSCAVRTGSMHLEMIVPFQTVEFLVLQVGQHCPGHRHQGW